MRDLDSTSEIGRQYSGPRSLKSNPKPNSTGCCKPTPPHILRHFARIFSELVCRYSSMLAHHAESCHSLFVSSSRLFNLTSNPHLFLPPRPNGIRDPLPVLGAPGSPFRHRLGSARFPRPDAVRFPPVFGFPRCDRVCVPPHAQHVVRHQPLSFPPLYLLLENPRSAGLPDMPAEPRNSF